MQVVRVVLVSTPLWHLYRRISLPGLVKSAGSSSCSDFDDHSTASDRLPYAGRKGGDEGANHRKS